MAMSLALETKLFNALMATMRPGEKGVICLVIFGLWPYVL